MGATAEIQPDVIQSLKVQSNNIQSVNAALVNISGRQRMLSQRVAMFCWMLACHPPGAKRADLREQLHQLIKLIEQSHIGLIEGNRELNLPGRPSDAVRAMYFEPPFDIDRQVRNFIHAVRTFLQQGDVDIQHSDPNLEAITKAASQRLLPALDAVVTQYQKESEAEQRAWENERLAILAKESQLLQQAEQRSLELKIAKEKAEAANVAKSRFLANMSHELRTPLNAVLGFSQLMGRDASLNTEQQATLSTINHSGKHLLNLINDVLEMSKIEAGRATLNPRDFDICQLLDSLHQMFSLKAEQKGIQLTINYLNPEHRYVFGDESKLRQILINVVSNAMKFTHQGQIRLTVQSHLIPSHSNASELTSAELAPAIKQQKFVFRFLVEDTGDGIADDELKHLFEMFAQTSTGRRSQQGTGLGLAISRRFAQLMQGDIAIDSKLNQGTNVDVQVQLAQNISQPNQNSPSRYVTGLAANQLNYRILIVEDREENRQLLSQYMTMIGFQVQVCHNGQEAVSCWKQWQPHFIWMDWQMPVMNGYETTQAIRDLEHRRSRQSKQALGGPSPHAVEPSLPLHKTVIVALSASVFEETTSEIMEAGCDDFIRKPFHESQLFDTLQKHLGVRYSYAEVNVTTTECQSPIVSHQNQLELNQLTEAMEHLPQQFLLELQSAASNVEEKQLQQLIASIQEQYPQPASILQMLLDQLRLDIISDLAQQALESREPLLKAVQN